MARMHQCYQLNCHKLIPIEKQYCEEHAQLHPKATGDRQYKLIQQRHYNKSIRKQGTQGERTKFYKTKMWRKVRDTIYQRDSGTCQICGRAGQIVDHKKPLAYFPDLALKEDNLWLLCRKCHNKKTEWEKEYYKNNKK